MAYASLYHVQALNPARVYGASTVPASAQVQVYLDQTAARIDMILTEQGYKLPVPTTATLALKFLEGLNTQAAWEMVERAAPASPFAQTAEKIHASMLKMLIDRQVIMDAPKTDARDSPRGMGFTQPAVGITPTPYFTRDQMF